jgi:hypothetical protein
MKRTLLSIAVQRALMLSISAAVMTWATSAVADSPYLKGDYGSTGSASCIVSPLPFIDDVAQATGPIQWLAIQGIRTFNGDGTGSAKFSALGVARPAAGNKVAGEAFTVVFSFPFTYTVNGDGTWTAVSGLVSGTLESGPQFTITGFPTFTGQISQNASTLTAATLTPSQETIVYTQPGPSTVYRICERTEVLIKLR